MSFVLDQKSLENLNDGDRQIFLQAYDCYAPKIFRFIYYRNGHDVALGEELTQNTFCKIWEYISSGKGRIQNLRAFLYQTARNLLIDHWRAQGQAQITSLDEQAELIGEVPRWQEISEAKLEASLIEAALDQIPDSYKEIIIMRFMEELSAEEISTILGKSKNSVYVLIHRALKAVKKVIEQQPVTKANKQMSPVAA